MYCRSVFVLLSFFAAVVTSQNTPACNDATTALTGNQPCFNAFTAFANAISLNASITSGVDLNVYCAQSCIRLVNRALSACRSGDPDRNIAVNQFICTADSDGMSCYDFIFSARFAALQNDLERTCSDDAPVGQMCSSSCQTTFQNSIIDGGCCYVELLELGSQIADMSLEESVLARCPVDLSRGGTCTEIGSEATGEIGSEATGEIGSGDNGEIGDGATVEIGGGATGLKAFGTVLMFAIIIAVTVI